MAGANDDSELIAECEAILEEGDCSGRTLYAKVVLELADELNVALQYRDEVVEQIGRDSLDDLQIDLTKILTHIRQHPSFLDDLYTETVSRDQRQRLGQYFTPSSVARAMVSLLPEEGTVLDPAVGPGVFAEETIEQEVGDEFLFNDVDPLMLCATEMRITLLGGDISRIELQNENFLTAELDEGIDSIICNPPYNKFQNHSGEVARKLEDEVNVSLGGFTNIYPLFLLKAVSNVNNGRVVFITPFEFLDTGYGATLKEYLLDNVNIRAIIGLKWDTGVFDGALTTAAITIIDTDGPTEEIAFIKSEQESDLDQIVEEFPKIPDNQPVRVKESSNLDPSEKWSRFFDSALDTEYVDATVPLGELADVKRGIATGHNEFFTLTKTEIEKWGIEDEYIRPVLSKAAQAPHYTVTKQDLEEQYQADKRVHLLYINGPPSDNVTAYLEHGKTHYEAHDRYLTSHRDPWYKPERRDSCPILATVFSRDNMRFIHNETDALNLAAFHCVYPEFEDEKRIRALLGYLNSDPALQLSKFQKRQYADGLDKFEPGDLSEIPVLDVRRLSNDQVTELANLFTQLDAASREQTDERRVQSELNTLVQELLDEHKELRDKERITSWADSDP